MKVKKVPIAHPYYGYRRIWREINKKAEVPQKHSTPCNAKIRETARFHQSLDYNVPVEADPCGVRFLKGVCVTHIFFGMKRTANFKIVES